MSTKNKEVASVKETDTAIADKTETSAEKGPLWSDESDSKRVRVSLWAHPRRNGKVAWSVGINRSYYDQESHEWVNTSFFNPEDLEDVQIFAQEAKARIERLSGEDVQDA